MVRNFPQGLGQSALCGQKFEAEKTFEDADLASVEVTGAPTRGAGLPGAAMEEATYNH